MAGRASALTRRRLAAEATALYLGVPLAIAVLLPPRRMFLALALFSLLAIWLLWRTGGFDWRSLMRGWGRVPWAQAGLLALVTLAIGTALLSALRPEGLFAMVRANPAFLGIVWVFYPILSALPQELIFRPLFFHRYGALLPPGPAALAINAAVFSFAHLMYWSPLVALLTFAGGLVFARAYVTRGFPAAFVLHSVAGNVLFATGMGVWFYSGNVVRPF